MTLSFNSYGSQQLIEKPAWRENFEQKINNPKHEIYQNAQELWKTINHNPDIQLIKDDNPNVIHQSGPTLFIHGWNSSPDAYSVYRQCTDSKTIPGDVVTFRFPDASSWFKKTVPYWFPISKSSFAAEPDIKTLL